MVSFWVTERQCLKAIRWMDRDRERHRTSSGLRVQVHRWVYTGLRAQKPHTNTKTSDWKIKAIHLLAHVLTWLQRICAKQTTQANFPNINCPVSLDNLGPAVFPKPHPSQVTLQECSYTALPQTGNVRRDNTNSSNLYGVLLHLPIYCPFTYQLGNVGV